MSLTALPFNVEISPIKDERACGEPDGIFQRSTIYGGSSTNRTSLEAEFEALNQAMISRRVHDEQDGASMSILN